MNKSSKYTQASSPLEVGEYPLPEELSGPQHYLNNSSSSEFLLKDDTLCPRPFTPERPPSRVVREDIEMMCNCGVRNPGYQTKGRGKGHWGSEQNIVLNRSYTSLPKLDVGNQYSLDRKIGKRAGRHSKHTYVCEQNRRILERLERKASLKRIRSPPEVHRGRECPRHGYLAEGDLSNTWKECKCDDYGFVGRGGSYRIPSSRGQCRGGRRRPAGDGMDAEMDAPELLFGLAPPDHILGDATCIQCPYSDHVHYAPAGYAPCLQLVGPADVEIVDVDECPGFIQNALIFDLHKDFYDKRQHISGNITISFDIDDELMISLYGYGFPEDWSGRPSSRTYINRKSLCRIVDNYLQDHALSSAGFCPVPAGVYEIADVSSPHVELDLPFEMLGYRNFRVELTKYDRIVACKEFRVKNTPRNVGFI